MTSRRDGSSLGELLAQSPALNPPDRLSWHAWREIVGSKVAQRSRPAHVDRQTLIVIVSSSTWAQELSLLQGTILERVRVKLPSVRSLRFQVGHLEPQALPTLKVRVIPAELPGDLEARICLIEDESLRATLREAASLSLGLRLQKSKTPKR